MLPVLSLARGMPVRAVAQQPAKWTLLGVSGRPREHRCCCIAGWRCQAGSTCRNAIKVAERVYSTSRGSTVQAEDRLFAGHTGTAENSKVGRQQARSLIRAMGHAAVNGTLQSGEFLAKQCLVCCVRSQIRGHAFSFAHQKTIIVLKSYQIGSLQRGLPLAQQRSSSISTAVCATSA